MNFFNVIECLMKGGSAGRASWTENKEIVMQIPQCIAKEIVPKMTSLPASIKPKIGTVGSGEIAYHDQVLMITFTDDEKTPASATYYIPTWEDILAEDWRCATPFVDKVKDDRPVTERIKTFEDACNALGDEHPFVTQYRLTAGAFKGDPKIEDFIAYFQLRIITAALNEGWEPQFTEEEYRYFPWYVLYTQAEIDAMDEAERSELLYVGGYADHGARCGLSYAVSYDGFSISSANIGARLAFKSHELAIYAGNQFRDIYSAFLFKPVQKI